MRRTSAWYLPVVACFSLLLTACADAILEPELNPAGPSMDVQLKPIVAEASGCSNPTWWRDANGQCWPPDPGSGSGDGGSGGSGDGDGGGGGGGGEDPNDPADPDPCETGDEKIDSPEVQDGFDDLWEASNADADLEDRTERGGWIVRTPTGFRVHPWTNVVTSFCGGQGWEPWPPEGSGAVVGFVHTHPYSYGETVKTCEGNSTPYLGIPSTFDMGLAEALGNQLGFPGGLPGIIIDANGISRYNAVQYNSNTDRFSRCGY